MNHAPEQSLAVLMGMFGSAFCASFSDMERITGMSSFISKALDAFGTKNSRVVPPSANYHFLFSSSHYAHSLKSNVSPRPLGSCRLVSASHRDVEIDGRQEIYIESKTISGESASPCGVAESSRCERMGRVGDLLPPADPCGSSSSRLERNDEHESQATVEVEVTGDVAIDHGVTLKTEECQHSLPVASERILPLMDMGVAVNATLPQFFRPERGVDLVFVFDARPSENDVHGAKDVLLAFDKFACRHAMRCPRIVYRNLGIDSMSVFHCEREHASVPTVAYIPLVSHAQYETPCDPALEKVFGFGNFTYSKTDFDRLKGLAKHNLQCNRDKIVDLLRHTVLRKRETLNRCARVSDK